jgi:type II secretory pathway pseudopilin PulG
MRTRPQRADPEDTGFTLIEILVATALFTVLCIALGTLAVLGMRTSTGLSARLDNATQGQIGMEASTKLLRTAVLPSQLADQVCVGCTDTAIVTATRSQVSFYANLNNTGAGPSLVTMQVLKDPDATQDAGMLSVTTQPPTAVPGGGYQFCSPAGTASCVAHTRVVTRGLAWPEPPIFDYYDYDGLRITTPVLTHDDLARVSSIDISLTVRTVRRSGLPSGTAVQRVRLPNAEINVLVQPSATTTP